MTTEISRRGLIGMGLGAALIPAVSRAQTAKEKGGDPRKPADAVAGRLNLSANMEEGGSR